MKILKNYQTKNLTPEQIEIKKQYYRDYYQRRKREKGIFFNEKRGRKALPKPPPFKFHKCNKPYILTFD
tara:strand:- start:3433 stop:3639 length:207 start_codon:yes stop_codon:yes gene_type:complete